MCFMMTVLSKYKDKQCKSYQSGWKSLFQIYVSFNMCQLTHIGQFMKFRWPRGQGSGKCHARIQWGETGSGPPPPPPPEKSQNIGFLAILVWTPRKNTKLPNQHSMLGHHRHASETPIKMAFRWRANDGPLMLVFGSYLPSSTKKKKKIWM